MPKKPKYHRPKGFKGGEQTKRDYDRKRAGVESRKWYSSKRWKQLRAIVLASEPYCARCERRGIVTPSDTVNHKRPHRGSYELFWQRSNLEGVCASCHSSEIQGEEAAERHK